MTLHLVRFVSLLLVALLGGTSFGIVMGFDPSQYSASTYVEQQQHLVRALHSLMVSMVIAATIITIVSAVLQRKNKAVFVALLCASMLLGSCILISRFGNLPIQQEMLTWTVNTVPTDWTTLRDKWWMFHKARTIVELIALAIVAWSTTRTCHEYR